MSQYGQTFRQYKKVLTADLVKYHANSRTHSNEQIEQIVRSVNEFGFTNPLLIDENNTIIAGHGRLEAALSMGLEELPCIVIDGLSEAQRAALVIADNKIALNSGWDNSILASQFEFLKEFDFDLSLTGFGIEELCEILPDELPEVFCDEDECPDVPEEPITKLGDVWLLGDHRLMCGDSTSIDAVEKLINGNKADMVFTDPPYGYKYKSNHQNKHKELLNDDKILDFAPIACSVMNDNSSIFICGSFQTISKWIDNISSVFNYKNLIVWEKNNWSMGDLKGAFAGKHELIIFASKGKVELIGKRDPDVWHFDREAPDSHPTQKPIELIEYALSKVKSNNVLDLFGGSGSTLIACEKLKRKCYMMELDPKYCDVIVKRWEQYTGKKAVLEVKNDH